MLKFWQIRISSVNNTNAYVHKFGLFIPSPCILFKFEYQQLCTYRPLIYFKGGIKYCSGRLEHLKTDKNAHCLWHATQAAWQRITATVVMDVSPTPANWLSNRQKVG